MKNVTAGNKLLYYASMGIILIGIILIIVCGYLAFTPVIVIHPNQQPYPAITKVVKAGDPFVYRADLCKYREAPTILIRRFVDDTGLVYALPAEDSNISIGCSKIGVRVVTPATLHPGTWYLTIDSSYRVNPFRTESYHLRTETFTIK